MISEFIVGRHGRSNTASPFVYTAASGTASATVTSTAEGYIVYDRFFAVWLKRL